MLAVDSIILFLQFCLFELKMLVETDNFGTSDQDEDELEQGLVFNELSVIPCRLGATVVHAWKQVQRDMASDSPG